MQSALSNPRVVQEYLEKEALLSRIVGPINSDLEAACKIQVSRFGVIPKKYQKGKWRLILDLSHPQGWSVNDGIAPELCSLSYASVDQAAEQILTLGKGTLLAKVDLENAYRMIPVHPDDRPLLGMKWNKEIWVDTALPFGLRSAPKLFNVMADCLQWIISRHNPRCNIIHYLDDFLLMGPPRSDICKFTLGSFLNISERLGVRISLHKLEGPATQLTFLGILLDTERMEVRLPEDKMEQLQQMVAEWRAKRTCTKRELLSLLGVLHHACQVVRPGRSFLRRMIELTKVVKPLHHHIRLNSDFRSDLQWWATFLPKWNGVGMMSTLSQRSDEFSLTTDASGSWGCGGFTIDYKWFQFPWPAGWIPLHITIKELLPIVIGTAVWGKSWAGRTVTAYTDNAAVVSIINSGRSKDLLAMHLMRCLFFITATHNCVVKAIHIQGKLNVAADALSRNQLDVFFQQVPGAEKDPTPIHQDLIRMLVTNRPDWTSREWRKLLENSLQKDSPVPLKEPTSVEKTDT